MQRMGLTATVADTRGRSSDFYPDRVYDDRNDRGPV